MFSTFQPKYPALFVLLLLGTCALSVPRFANAAGIPIEAFLSSAEGRYVLLRAPGADEFLMRAAGVSFSSGMSREELVDLARTRLELPEFAAERSAVEERLHRIQESFSKTPAGEKTHATDSELTRDEKLWLNEASSHLRVNPEWRPSTESGRSIDFFASSPAENFEGTRATFLRQAPDPALADDGASTPVAERPGARARLQKYLAEMKTCVADRPPAETLKINYKYMLTQLATDEVMTVGGAIVAAGGVDNVDWKTLPNDLAFEAFSSLGDSLIAATPGAKFNVRWYRLQAFGVMQSSADAVIYTVSQSRTQHSVSTGARFAYNSAWNATYANLSVGLYDLISGLECMNASTAVIFGAQLGAGLGANVAYFGLRNSVLGRNSE